MSYNGNGVYSPPSPEYPAVTNTTISSSDFNTIINDIAVALTNCLTKDGQSTASAKINFASGVGTDTISERTSNTGVTVDGMLIKDGGLTADDDAFLIQDNLDNTKKLAVDCSGITTGNTRTLTIPDKSGIPLLASDLIGEIKMWAGSTAPTGWFELNGSAISRTTYANLFAILGTTYGAGDGSTTFNLPDLRGEFVRGWDHGRGVDSGRARGSNQGEAYKNHNHTASTTGGNHRHECETGHDEHNEGMFTPGNAKITNLYTNYSGDLSLSTVVNNSTTGGAETRPRNLALMYIIKHD